MIIRQFIQQMSGTPPPYVPPSDTPTEPVEGRVLEDPRFYVRYSQPAQTSDGTLLDLVASAGGHALAGKLLFGVSDEGGVNTPFTQINMPTIGLLNVYDHKGSYVDGRYHIAFITASDYSSVHFGYTDDEGDTWHYSGTLSFPTDYTGSMGTGDVVKLPSGKLIWPYYAVGDPFPTGGTRLGIFQSVDNGVTWTDGTPISTSHAGGTFPNGAMTEVEVWKYPGAVADASQKLVAVARNEEYGFWTHFKSANGGASWTEDTTNLVGYPFGSATQERPLTPVTYGGQVYLICGNRGVDAFNVFDPKLQYVTVSYDNFYNNVLAGYSSLTTVSLTPNAKSLGQPIDWGYVRAFEDTVFNTGLWVRWYDVHPSSIANEGYTHIYQFQLIPPP